MPTLTVNRSNFDSIVIEGSKTKPVLVDFWAPWCGPCRTLAPILDKLAGDFSARMTLVKLNTDEEPELAARYGIRGIPNCKLFAGGEVVDEVTGALPERTLREWLAAALPSPAAALVRQAEQHLDGGDAQRALALLDEAANIDPDDEALLLARVEALLAVSRFDDARAIAAALERPGRGPLRDPGRFASLKARAALTDPVADDITDLARAAAAGTVDCAAKLTYAKALAARGDYEPALDQLLAVVQADRSFGDDIARKTMLTIFDALGSDNDIVRRYRRELAAALNR
jgi:putative thioredoxin